MIPPNEKAKIKESIVQKLVEKYKSELPEDFHILIQKKVDSEVTEYLRTQVVTDKSLKLLEKRIKKFQTDLKRKARDRLAEAKEDSNIRSDGNLPVFTRNSANGLNRTRSFGAIRQPTPKSLGTTNTKRSFYQAG